MFSQALRSTTHRLVLAAVVLGLFFSARLPALAQVQTGETVGGNQSGTSSAITNTNTLTNPVVVTHPLTMTQSFPNTSGQEVKAADDGVGLGAILDLINKAVDLIQRVTSILNGSRSVVLIMVNHSELTLGVASTNHAHGGFQTSPDPLINPESVSVFSSRDKSWSIGTGTEGEVVYTAPDLQIKVTWDNPFAGSNSCNLELSGPNAYRYWAYHSCGAGNTGAQMKYALIDCAALPEVEIRTQCAAFADSGPGQIQIKHNQLADAGFDFGAPDTDFLPTPDGIGFYRHYQSGASIYWSPNTGSHEVHSIILDKWASLGWEQGSLGYPTTDQSPTGDAQGGYNHFQHGSIYWSPQTDVHVVNGAIQDLWASMGWEQGSLGYPVTDEMVTPSDNTGHYNVFQHGTIYCYPYACAYASRAVLSNCNPSLDQVALFLDINYGGLCILQSAGDYANARSIGLPNKSISSIKVGAHAQIVLCRDDNYQSYCETFTADSPNLTDNGIGNDQASSAKISTTHPLLQVYLPVIMR